QAEDGVRDFQVTGVQTWALPISGGRGPRRQAAQWRRPAGWWTTSPTGREGVARDDAMVDSFPSRRLTHHGRVRLEAITWERLGDLLADRLLDLRTADGGPWPRVALDGAPAARPG